MTGNDAVEVLSKPDIAKLGAGVGRMLALGPQPTTMTELDLGVFFRNTEHVWIEITETRREQQRRAAERDHALHGLLNIECFGDLFFLQNLDAGHRFHDGRTLRVGLVITIVVLRPDVDEADDEVLGEGCLRRQGASQGRSRGTYQKLSA